MNDVTQSFFYDVKGDHKIFVFARSYLKIFSTKNTSSSGLASLGGVKTKLMFKLYNSIVHKSMDFVNQTYKQSKNFNRKREKSFDQLMRKKLFYLLVTTASTFFLFFLLVFCVAKIFI